MNAKAKTRPALKNRAPSGSVSLTRRLKSYDRHRQFYNPVRGLTMARAVSLIESYPRGDYADLMWTFGAPFTGIECSDADLLALIERRTAALTEMDWNVPIIDREKIDLKLAEEQQAYIRELVDGIDNLVEAIEHLELGFVRSFSLMEKIQNPDGDILHLECVDHWNVVRDGTKGRWKYNPEALFTNFQALPEENLIDPAHWVIHEVPRSVGRIALVKFIRQNLSQKDWDAFIEIYGLPSGVVTGPPDVPREKEADYQAAAEDISKGGSGYLPNGSTYTPNDQPRGVNPFRDHLKFLQEQLILAGTGGKLTMLAESGSGNLAGGAHSDTFKQIARSRAKKISECLHKQLIKPLLDLKFSGREHLAYFELAYREEVEAKDVIDHAVKLSSAGFQMDAGELSEKTGYKLISKPPANAPQTAPGGVFPNRTRTKTANRRPGRNATLCNADAERSGGRLNPDFAAKALERLGSAQKPVLERLEKLLATPEADFPTELEKLKTELPDLLGDDDDAVAAWEEVLGTALMEGLTKQ